MSEPFAPVTPHAYSPDIMAMGDCRVCGHDRDHPMHQQQEPDSKPEPITSTFVPPL